METRTSEIKVRAVDTRTEPGDDYL